MKYSDIKELSNEEIVVRIKEEKTQISKVIFAHSVSAIENPSRIYKSRKDVARLNTELTKRNALAASESKA